MLTSSFIHSMILTIILKMLQLQSSSLIWFYKYYILLKDVQSNDISKTQWKEFSHCIFLRIKKN
jgi:hypothetical protein